MTSLTASQGIKCVAISPAENIPNIKAKMIRLVERPIVKTNKGGIKTSHNINDTLKKIELMLTYG